MPTATSEKKRLADLERQLAQAQKTIGNLQKKIDTQEPAHEGRLISKPSGQAGRGNGFKLEPSMGLKKPHYNRLLRMTRVCANTFLDPRKSFQEQDKKKVEAVINHIRKTVKTFKHYRDGWPIRSILIQHLANSKKRWNQDLKVEHVEPRGPNREAIAVYKRSLEDKSGKKSKEKAQDTEDEESDEEELEDDTEEPKDDEELEDDEEEIEFKVVDECDEGHQLEEEDPDFEPDSEEEQFAGDQSEVEPETASKSKYGKWKHVHETEIPTSTTMKVQVCDQEERVHEKKRRGEELYGENFREWEERSGDELSEDMTTKSGKKKRISKTKVSVPKPIKAPVTIHDQEERVREKNPIKRAQELPDEGPVAKQSKKDKKTSFSGTKCPEFDCSDVVPELLSESLKTQLEELAKIRLEGTKGTPYMLSAQICLAIRREREFPALKLLGEQSKWPSTIDFKSLSDRVFFGLRRALNGMLQNHIVLGCSTSWTSFSSMLTMANTSLVQFSQARDSTKFTITGKNKHAGYYGPMGEFIILTTLSRMYKDILLTLVSLASTLRDLSETETAESELGDSYCRFWNGAEFGTSPIQPRDFFEYILLPETAVLLISQDLHISKAEAYGIWVRSKGYGDAFNSSTDDGMIDDLNNENLKAQRVGISNGSAPPRVQRKGPLPPPFQVQNATPGPGPQTAARMATHSSPRQDAKKKKSAKAVKPVSKVTQEQPARRSTRLSRGKEVSLNENTNGE